jgi:gamma-glutamylcyclotransferase (GGCT)/AIG2-like uncharacterized protein YtfP
MRNQKKRLYIAYGSNLNREQMARRCPTAKVAGASELQNFRLMFRGGNGYAVATVEPCKGGSVPVLIWELTPADEAALDIYEGWPTVYRKEKSKVGLDGKTVAAFIYVMNGNSPCGRPNDRYYGVILDGYTGAGFDPGILSRAAEDSINTARTTDDAVVRQIIAVRDTGETNMFDTGAVLRIALRDGHFGLADWLPAHKSEYVHFIFTGEMKGGPSK